MDFIITEELLAGSDAFCVALEAGVSDSMCGLYTCHRDQLAYYYFSRIELQWVSMNHFILTGRKKHIWRNIMIGIQWTISMFFVGGVILIWMSWNELIFDKMYMPLSDQEEDQIVMLPLNSSRLKENIEPIITEVRKMPEVEEVTYISMLSDLQSYTYMNYKHADGRTSLVQMGSGNTDYFRFFHIPMDGKKSM